MSEQQSPTHSRRTFEVMIAILMFLNAFIALGFAGALFISSLGTLFPVSTLLVAAAIASTITGIRLAKHTVSPRPSLQIALAILNGSFLMPIAISLTKSGPFMVIAAICAVIIYAGSAFALFLPGIARRKTIAVPRQAEKAPVYVPLKERSEAPSNTVNLASKQQVTLELPSSSADALRSEKVNPHTDRVRSIAIIFLFAPFLLSVSVSVFYGLVTIFIPSLGDALIKAHIMGAAGIGGFLLLVAGIWLLLRFRHKP